MLCVLWLRDFDFIHWFAEIFQACKKDFSIYVKIFGLICQSLLLHNLTLELFRSSCWLLTLSIFSLTLSNIKGSISSLIRFSNQSFLGKSIQSEISASSRPLLMLRYILPDPQARRLILFPTHHTIVCLLLLKSFQHCFVLFRNFLKLALSNVRVERSLWRLRVWVVNDAGFGHNTLLCSKGGHFF